VTATGVGSLSTFFARGARVAFMAGSAEAEFEGASVFENGSSGERSMGADFLAARLVATFLTGVSAISPLVEAVFLLIGGLADGSVASVLTTDFAARFFAAGLAGASSGVGGVLSALVVLLIRYRLKREGLGVVAILRYKML
jgi:hypothetical protein